MPGDMGVVALILNAGSVVKLVGGGRQLTLKLPERFLHQKEWLEWELMSLSTSL